MKERKKELKDEMVMGLSLIIEISEVLLHAYLTSVENKVKKNVGRNRTTKKIY